MFFLESSSLVLAALLYKRMLFSVLLIMKVMKINIGQQERGLSLFRSHLGGLCDYYTICFWSDLCWLNTLREDNSGWFLIMDCLYHYKPPQMFSVDQTLIDPNSSWKTVCPLTLCCHLTDWKQQTNFNFTSLIRAVHLLLILTDMCFCIYYLCIVQNVFF